MSLARTVAGILGVIYVLLGFLPDPLVQTSATPSATGALLGIFPINPLHSVLHLVIGAALLYASMETATAIIVARLIGVASVLVGVLGFVSPDGFSLLPLGGADIFLHLGTAAVLLAIGFMRTEMRAVA